jgi:hypothetical protein
MEEHRREKAGEERWDEMKYEHGEEERRGEDERRALVGR